MSSVAPGKTEQYGQQHGPLAYSTKLCGYGGAMLHGNEMRICRSKFIYCVNVNRTQLPREQGVDEYLVPITHISPLPRFGKGFWTIGAWLLLDHPYQAEVKLA